jgi:hypothetical protein
MWELVQEVLEFSAAVVAYGLVICLLHRTEVRYRPGKSEW